MPIYPKINELNSVLQIQAFKQVANDCRAGMAKYDNAKVLQVAIYRGLLYLEF